MSRKPPQPLTDERREALDALKKADICFVPALQKHLFVCYFSVEDMGVIESALKGVE